MAKYPFLSDEWVAEARRIYAEVQSAGEMPPSGALAPVRVNLVVNDAPFASEPLHAHVDTSHGHVAIETGHLENPDVIVSLDYGTARSLFVNGGPQAVMQAFLSGRVRVDGDMTKLLDPRSGMWPAVAPASWAAARPGDGSQTADAQQGVAPPPRSAFQGAARLQEITE